MKTYEHPALEQVELSAVMHALSDPCRIAIVRALLEKPDMACNELPADVSKATLSHHMEVLRGAGLIETRVVGAKCLSAVRNVEVDEKFPGILALVGQD